MGVFGYNKKDFDKNTANFANQLTKMAGEMIKYPAVGKLVNQAVIVFGQKPYEFESFNMKELAAVDTYLKGLIDDMRMDLQKGDAEMMKAHAQLLVHHVSKSRYYGKLAGDEEGLRAEKIAAETEGLLRSQFVQKDSIKEHMRELEEEADALDENDTGFDMLNLEYKKCKRELENVMVAINTYQNRYNANVEIMSARGMQSIYTALPPQIETQREFDRLTDSITQMAMKEAEYVTGITESSTSFRAEMGSIVGGASTDTGDDLHAYKQAKKIEEMSSGIAAADAHVASDTVLRDPVTGKRKLG